MHLQIIGVDFEIDAWLDRYVRRSLDATLFFVEARLDRTTVRFSRSGDGARLGCRVSVKRNGGSVLTAEAAANEPREALLHALDQLRRRIRRRRKAYVA